MHGVASQEKQEYSVKDKPAIIHIPAEATPLVAKEVRDKGMAEQLHTLFGDLKEAQCHNDKCAKNFRRAYSGQSLVRK